MNLFKLWGEIGVRNTEANQAIDETTSVAEGAESKMSAAFKKIGAAVATYFAVDKIVSFGKEIVNVAAEVSAEASAFEQIMGDYASQASEKVMQIANETGMVDTRLTPYMTSMTAKFKGLGYDIDDATDLAQTGLTIAADAAAFWDKSLDDAMGSLNSFVNGNYEGGEAIGLFANETTLATWASENLGFKWDELTEKEKQFARLQFAKAMQEASGATGQAAKESKQYANVQANLNEKWRQFKAQIGEPILQNVVLPAMEKLSGLVDKLSSGFETLSTWASEHQTLVTILAIGVGTLATAIIAYNIAQNAATIATTIATAATTAFGAVMAFVTSPITLVILAIGALIAIAVLLYKNWDTVSAKAKEIWNNIKSTITNVVNGIKDTISKVFDNVKTTVINIFDSVKSKATSIWNGIKTAIETPINKAKDTVKAGLNAIKGFFDKLKIKFPDIKLPHFNIKGSFSLSPPSVPKLSIDWYAKGGVLNKPTLFDYNPKTGRAKVGGEAGAEAIAPIDTLLGYIRTAVKEENSGLNYYLEKLISMLAEYMPQLISGANRQLVLDSGVLVGQLAPQMDSKLGDINELRKRGR